MKAAPDSAGEADNCKLIMNVKYGLQTLHMPRQYEHKLADQQQAP